MRKLSIERFEGVYAYCEDDDRKMYAIEKTELPAGVKAGDVISISDGGVISLDEQETAVRKARISKLHQKLWDQ